MSEVPGGIDKTVRPILIDDLHPEWQVEAKCLGVGTAYFFGQDDQAKSSMSISQVRRAAKLCDTCPVFRQCITQAILGKEEYGIWGGTTGKVRKNIRGMITREEVTPEQVIEDICHGVTDKYKPKPEATRSRSERREGSRSRSIPATTRWDVAI